MFRRKKYVVELSDKDVQLLKKHTKRKNFENK